MVLREPILVVTRTRLYRLAVPAAAFSLLAAFTALWIGGWHEVYFGLLRPFGADPFRFPFVDTHALLSAAECHRLGVNVYIENPCDVLGRPHVYSPLWLPFMPSFLSTASTNALGFTLDLAFIGSLWFVFRPLSWRETAVFLVIALSPVTAFAVERANNDILVFLLAVAAALLWARAERRRSVAYLLVLAAGLLKYYPLVLFLLIARERLRRALMLATAAGVSVGILTVCYRGELAMALGNIPTGTHFSDAFSARNFPFGIMELIGGSTGSLKLPAVCLLLLLTGAAIMHAWQRARLIEAHSIDWSEWELRILVVAGLLLPACFFTAQNITYRGIFLMLAVPGLVHLRRAATQFALKRWSTRMIAAILFLLWGSLGFRSLALVGLNPSGPAESGADMLARISYWLVHEFVWWWLIAGMLALVIAWLRSLPLPAEMLTWLRRMLPLPARQ